MKPVVLRRLAGLVLCGLLIAAGNPSINEALRAAQAGDARAQYTAGMMYVFGQGTRQNISEGARWLEASALAGTPQAMVALAALYDVGQGVSLDTARATELRQQAAHAGDTTARAQLADDRRLKGQSDFRRASVLTDLKQPKAAIPYARRAAEAGSANAQLLLGRAYQYGLGVSVNLPEAVKWYEKSAAGGLADGARHLAYLYEFGVGVDPDKDTALKYYDRASAAGDERATQAASNLRSPDYNPPSNYGAASHGSEVPSSPCPTGYSFDRATARCNPYDSNRDSQPAVH